MKMKKVILASVLMSATAVSANERENGEYGYGCRTTDDVNISGVYKIMIPGTNEATGEYLTVIQGNEKRIVGINETVTRTGDQTRGRFVNIGTRYLVGLVNENMEHESWQSAGQTSLVSRHNGTVGVPGHEYHRVWSGIRLDPIPGYSPNTEAIWLGIPDSQSPYRLNLRFECDSALGAVPSLECAVDSGADLYAHKVFGYNSPATCQTYKYMD